MLYLRTKRGLLACLRDARRARKRFGSVSFAMHRVADDAFSVSMWDGTRYIGPLIGA